MHLTVFSHKPCWPSADSLTGWATDGGFPFQMARLSELFDSTRLVLPRPSSPPPAGLRALDGHRLSVRAFREPPFRGTLRKLAWLSAGMLWLPRLWRETGRADAVHAAVPGDVGFVGLLLALLRRKPLFVRHCGTWGRPETFADRLLLKLLVRIADGRRVVLATGGGDASPALQNPAIGWIFSTTLSAAELTGALPSRSATEPRLICVARLTPGKNVGAAIRALVEIRRSRPSVVLDVVGHGPERERLRALAVELDLGAAVVFHGNLGHDAVLERLREADVFVFPTRVAEGFPKAVLEALACGLPVVAPRVSVIPRLLGEDGGVVLDDLAPATIAAAVLGLLDRPRDPERIRRTVAGYTLEAWRDAIGRRLEEAWGPLRRDAA